MSDTINPVANQERIWKDLRNEYQSEGWEDHHKELSLWFLPRKNWFIDRDNSNRGDKKNQNIINTTPLEASNTLASGMMAGITSPTRPWFSLSTGDVELHGFGPVANWLEEVERLMAAVFARSNVYKVLHSVYRELGVYGTGAMGLEYDPKDVIRGTPFPIGSYVLGMDARLRTEIFYREIPYKVWNLVKEFGFDACSDGVKTMYTNKNYNQTINVIHGLEPNNIRNLGSPLKKDMPWRSVYYEKSGNKGRYLRDSGFMEFPVFTPRWSTSGTDPYGSSPGMDVLGANKSMQIKEKRKNTLVDKLTNPPMQGPSSLQQSYASLIAGDITYIEPGASGKFEPAQTILPGSIEALNQDIARHEEQIRRAFFTDLFLMLTNLDRPQMTATEVAERHEEKLLMLGPVLENIHNDLLDPLIDRTFGIMLRNGLIPPAPEELQGKELKVEYISILAQAQRAVGVNSIRQTAGFIMDLAQVAPNVMDKFDADQAVNQFADMQGVPPTIIRSDKNVAIMRQQRAQQQAAQAAAAQAPEAAKTMKTMSETKINQQGESALEAALG